VSAAALTAWVLMIFVSGSDPRPKFVFATRDSCVHYKQLLHQNPIEGTYFRCTETPIGGTY